MHSAYLATRVEGHIQAPGTGQRMRGDVGTFTFYGLKFGPKRERGKQLIGVMFRYLINRVDPTICYDTHDDIKQAIRAAACTLYVELYGVCAPVDFLALLGV